EWPGPWPSATQLSGRSGPCGVFDYFTYGVFSAAGARDPPTNPATATIVTAYGSISKNSAGMSEPIAAITLPRFREKPNNSAAATAPLGLRRPRIMAARAI